MINGITTKRKTNLRLGLLVSTAISAGLFVAPVSAQNENSESAESAPTDVDSIAVVARRDDRVSEGATGLRLSVKDTPQTVTIVGSDVLEDFALDDANDVLKLVPGVHVERVESDRTYFNSRGFDIKSMQIDGTGIPFDYEIIGQTDTVMFERVEVVRGANALLTGVGTPSGTVNYVRKRPTNEFQAYSELSVRSWDGRRAEIDVSMPLTEDGAWAGRFVGAVDAGESYLDFFSNQKQIYYGVVDGQFGNNIVVTLGASHQASDSDGNLWGAPEAVYSNGVQTDFPVGTSNAQEWTYWNVERNTVFAEIVLDLPGDWEFETILTYDQYKDESVLFYTYGALDQATGLGLFGYPASYVWEQERYTVDAKLTGSFDAFGRSHDLLFGGNMSYSPNDYGQYMWDFTDPATLAAFDALPAFPGWSGYEIDRPSFESTVTDQGHWTTRLQRVFGVANLNIIDPVNVIAGFNFINVADGGEWFAVDQYQSESQLSPYVGVTYAVTDAINLYASYSDIYQPQTEVGLDFSPLGAAKGLNYEFGAKAEILGGRMLLSAAYFIAEQENYAEYFTTDVGTGINLYLGVDTETEGFEIEAVGQLTDRISVQAGYTHLEIEDADTGADARTFIPTDSASAAIRFAASDRLDLGTNLRWQDDVTSANGLFSQDSLFLASIYGSFDMTDNIQLSVNVDNLTDEKHYASLYWDQAFYDAPRSVKGILRVRY